MIISGLCFVVIFATSVFKYVEAQKPSIQLNINSVASKCINVSEMTEDQLQTAIQEKDLDKISACFFKCYLKHFEVVTRENGRDIVNVPMTLIFVKMYIPDISFFDLLGVGVEVANCSKDFEKNTPSDNHPHCFKTKALITCLAKKKSLRNALWLALEKWS